MAEDIHHPAGAPDPRFGDPIGNWHKWFAWYPIQTFDGRTSWLRTIERRRIQLKSSITHMTSWWWQYRRSDGYVEDKPITDSDDLVRRSLPNAVREIASLGSLSFLQHRKLLDAADRIEQLEREKAGWQLKKSQMAANNLALRAEADTLAGALISLEAALNLSLIHI